MKQLTNQTTEEHEKIVLDIAAKFAEAAGYQLVESNVNQWVVAVEAMLDGVVQILGQPEESDEEAKS